MQGHEFVHISFHMPASCEACTKPLWAPFRPPPALECRRESFFSCVQCCGSGSTGSTCFWPPGSRSGSISQRYEIRIRSFYHHAKIVRKTLIPTVLWLFWTFYLWKMMLMYLQKVICRNFFQNISFLLASWRLMTKKSRIRDPDPNPDPPVRSMDPRIRIHTKMSWIRNNGYVNCQYLVLSDLSVWLPMQMLQ